MLRHETGPIPTAPLYAEVRSRIVESLRQAEWGHGGRIPTEPQLAKRFSVSIGTVRKAIDALVAESILLRRPGRGTFVASHMNDTAFAQFLNVVDADGRRVVPEALLRSFTVRRAPAEVASRLQLRPGARVLHVENLRTWHRRPVMLDRIWVPHAFLADVGEADFAKRLGSIYGFYQERGLTVIRIDEDLCPVAPDPAVAEALEVPAATPLMLISRAAFSFGPGPVEFRHRFVAAGTIKYRNSIGLKVDNDGRAG